MAKLTPTLKRVVMVLPIFGVIGASFYPLQTWVQQSLILFTLIWFNVFILFDVLGK